MTSKKVWMKDEVIQFCRDQKAFSLMNMSVTAESVILDYANGDMALARTHIRMAFRNWCRVKELAKLECEIAAYPYENATEMYEKVKAVVESDFSDHIRLLFERMGNDVLDTLHIVANQVPAGEMYQGSHFARVIALTPSEFEEEKRASKVRLARQNGWGDPSDDGERAGRQIAEASAARTRP